MKEFKVCVIDEPNCKVRKFASRICQSDHNCLSAVPGMGGHGNSREKILAKSWPSLVGFSPPILS